ncbi:2,3-bisphosphoglycerate-dependent phosphoglycerate mutase [Arthrobacter pascens]|uniref:2,3-bisphosphoglycerate-dependent phosphoglycerate mutase n=1 Tax=Arthrobacter pascens TaxID=1677 RepID=UPI00196BA8FD|nr:2,3-diphosphoglycerate-dependent phosphoglycerate mutase [Arthrobacter pascens]MBN3499680.1 2,3-diphosphoglycerate-dependent phosphoglycerate mutase [Arthrobacter pascens]
MPGLVLLRHGESVANAEDVFAGWLDVPLTERGRAEARDAAGSLAGLCPDAVHTSVLRRAVETARLLIEEAGWELTPSAHWRLNERHYGALQGLVKDEARARFGAGKVQWWRRGADGRPPQADHAALAAQRSDPRYAALPEAAAVSGESLADVVERMMPYWHNVLAPELAADRTVVVVGHGNALRALMHVCTGMSLDQTGCKELGTAVPVTIQAQILVP